MTVRGILFDKDGTLIDFRATWLAAYQGAAAELAQTAGLEPSFAEELLARFGYDAASDSFTETSPLLWATNAAIARQWADQPDLRHVEDAFAIATRHFADETRYPPAPVGDLAALFTTLDRRGIALGLATMDTTEKAHGTLATLGLAGRLAFVTGYDGGHGEKPEPGMVFGFCAATGLAPEEVLVVGDTAADLLMARAAGAGMAVAVLTGATPRTILDLHADVVLDSVMQLESLL
jgi:phosphoglycolate phosphatase